MCLFLSKEKRLERKREEARLEKERSLFAAAQNRDYATFEALLADRDLGPDIKLRAVGTINDPDYLCAFAKAGKYDEPLRLEAQKAVFGEERLLDIAVNAHYTNVRREAASRLTDVKNILLAYTKQSLSNDKAGMMLYINAALSKLKDEDMRFIAARDSSDIFAQAAERTLGDSRYIVELFKLKGSLAPERDVSVLDALTPEELHGALLKFKYLEKRVVEYIINRFNEAYLQKVLVEHEKYACVYNRDAARMAAEKIGDSEFAARYVKEKHMGYEINESSALFEIMLGKTHDRAVLLEIAKNTNHGDICKILAGKIKNAEDLIFIAQNAKSAELFKYALDEGTSPELLKAVACRNENIAGFCGTVYDFDGDVRSLAIELLAKAKNKQALLYIADNAESETSARQARALAVKT